MRKSGPRLFGFGVPLACLIGTVCGAEEPAIYMLTIYYLFYVLSLFAPDAFSRASAKLMSTRKVMGGLLIAALIALLTAGGFFAILWHQDRMISDLYVCAAGAMLVIIRCFEELFASQGDRLSAQITTLLTAIGFGAMLILSEDPIFYTQLTPEIVFFAIAAAVLLISGAIALGFSRKEPPQLSPAIFKEIPAAFLRTLLFPALALGIQFLRHALDLPFARQTLLYEQRTMLLCGGYAGLILLEVTKSTFRRDKTESTRLKTGLALAALLIGLAPVAAGFLYWDMDMLSTVSILFTAIAAALLLYSSADWETIASAAVLLVAAALIEFGITPPENSFPAEIFIGPAAGVLLCAMMFNQWRELARLRKVNKIRKNALKNTKRPSF